MRIMRMAGLVRHDLSFYIYIVPVTGSVVLTLPRCPRRHVVPGRPLRSALPVPLRHHLCCGRAAEAAGVRGDLTRGEEGAAGCQENGCEGPEPQGAHLRHRPDQWSLFRSFLAQRCHCPRILGLSPLRSCRRHQVLAAQR